MVAAQQKLLQLFISIVPVVRFMIIINLSKKKKWKEQCDGLAAISRQLINI